MATILFFLALAPILWLVVSLSGMKMAGYKACPVALVLAVALALIVWKAPLQNVFTAALEGVALALWPIVLVILAAVFTYNLSTHTGYMELIKRMLTGVSTDRRILVLIVAWGFGGFLEGMAGFGTAIAIPASMLWGLGFDPLFSAAICLVANSAPTVFGSIGIPTTTLAQLTGLDPLLLSGVTAAQLAPLNILIPFVLVAMTGKSVKALRGMGLLTVVAGVTFVIPQFFVGRFIGAELATVIGAVCAMLAIIGWTRLLRKKPTPPAYEMAVPKQEPISFKKALVAWFPFILIFAFLILTSKIVPWINQALSAVKTSVMIYSGEGAAPYTFVWIVTPGVLILLAALIGGAVQGASLKEMLIVLGQTVKQMSKTIVTVVSVMATAKVMGYSGMIGTMAATVVAVTGPFYLLVAPLIGSLGGFITGSATSSSVLFGTLQTEAARTIGASPYWAAAANTAGATIGKMISPQSIAIAVTATSLAGKDGKILNAVIKYFVLFVVVMGLITFFGAPLASLLS